MNNLTKYNRPMDLFDWNGMLDRFFTDEPLWTDSVPAVDIREEENAYLMEVELPGRSEKDIEVKVEENLLTLSSKQEEKREEKRKGFLLKERRSSQFRRSFVLPDEVEREKIEAKFSNGLLKVTLPKSEKAKPKTIEVRVN